MSVDLKKKKDEAGAIATSQPSIMDFIGQEVNLKVDMGHSDMPMIGKLIDIDEYAYFYMEVGGRVTAINGVRVISITPNVKTVSKVKVGPDGDVAAKHQAGIDSKLKAYRNKAAADEAKQQAEDAKAREDA